ncbi:metallophosphoesterase family protein [Methanobacterium alcaliphilum]|uniref:metallophosphoesterase family protein n=1 Tax=Methanobacterium alcaliphilum TaxID=392018 RepID=UPI002009FFD7|nr:DNA repair exonuclease [Methanobacterium alcaliphilum]MCK9151704.1 DNA repair exonuclease [Methanobacterium alcaliphilum]
MQFAHLADTHLGYRQYGLFEREKDFYNIFTDIVEKIIEIRPDFVIHSGDLFEFSRPPTNALLTAQKGLLTLKEAEIPVYAIAGNHDIIMRKNAIPPHVLFKELGLKVISPNNPYFVEKDVFIGGLPYMPKHQSTYLTESLKNLESLSRGYDKRLIVLHQGIDKYLPYEYELELANLPESFNYYALGHIHSRITDDFGEGKLVYPGSTEIWKFDELGNYLKNGKGFSLVDLGADLPDVQYVNMELPREFIKTNMEFFKLEEEIAKLKEHILTLKEKPLLSITVEGGNFSRLEVFEELHDAFSEICLSLRPNFKSSDVMEKTELSGSALNPKKLIEERLNEFENNKVTDLAISLFDLTSEGNLEQAESVSKKFYGEFYDNQ